MDKKCPSCGNNNEFRPTLVNDEYLCEECGTEFSEVTNEAYTAPNYRMFCERVVKKMRSNVNDAIIASAIGELSEGYINDGPEYAKDFIERLSSIATDLYTDHKAGLREPYDFQAIMEGVENLIEFFNIQNPEDETFNGPMEDSDEEIEDEKEGEEEQELELDRPSEVFDRANDDFNPFDMPDDDGQNIDPAAMVDPNATPGEKTEHLALATLKGNVENLKNTLALLDNAEQQEREEGSEEGPEHEEQEAQMMANIKDAVNQLQGGLDGYLQGEVNAHYNAPTIKNKVDDIASKVNDETLDEATMCELNSQLKEICQEACGMMGECGYPIGEDTQLVTQDDMNAQYNQSINTNTQEMGNGQTDNQHMGQPSVTEAVIGGENIDPELVTPATAPPELEQPPHDEQYFGDPGFEDEKEDAGEIEDIPLDDQFREEQSVIFENEFWTIKGIKENSLMLESENGETIETDKENVELSNKEGFDAMEEHYERGTDNLRTAWEKMEESINNQKSLMKPVRRFDLREASFSGLKGGPSMKIGKTLAPANIKGMDPNSTIGDKVDVSSEPAGKDAVQSIEMIKKKNQQTGQVFNVVRLIAAPKDGGGNKVIYDAIGVGEKFYLRKTVRGANDEEISKEDLVKAGPKVKVINRILDSTDVEPWDMSDYEAKLDSTNDVKESVLPNSNIQI